MIETSPKPSGADGDRLNRPHFLTWEHDPVGIILGSRADIFHSSAGIDGLAREIRAQRRLDLLAVLAKHPGHGHFRRFIAMAKERYDVIGVWEITNPWLPKVLLRYGFKVTRETDVFVEGESSDGMIWRKT